MDTFDLRRLTDFDFELICKDLFEEILSVQLEVFAPGADQGIDLRCLKDNPRSSTIIQCKHWTRSGRTKLLSYMRHTELPKVRRLAPSRYIVACSVELTSDAKRILIHDFDPFIRNSSDIYGINEIESELRSRPHIVQRHPRLWLNSTAVLQGLLAKEVLIRSSALIGEIDQSLKSYAPNASLHRAHEILESMHALIISGGPGIGKTTLAHALLADYISRGFSVVEVSSDAEEVNRLWMSDEQQIFYYDDFLGQTTLVDKFQKNEESRLISVIRRVKSASNKRLILTTREYILAQARQRYEKFSETDLSPLKHVMGLADYTPEVRAQILYNHIYFSDLPDENMAAFSEPIKYRRIVYHDNFNPRIIQISVGKHAAGDSPETTVQRLFDDLQNPRRIWEHIVEHQLDKFAVSLLEVVFSLGEFPASGLRDAWVAYTAPNGDPRSFRHSIQLLEGTLVKLFPRGDEAWLDFHDPSARDYMIGYLSDRPETVIKLVERAIFFEQIWGVWILARSDRGRPVMEVLNAVAHLDSAIRRTLQSPNLRKTWGSGRIARANIVLEIARKIESSDLIRLLDASILRDIDFTEDAAGPEEVASLIKNLSNFELQLTQERAISLIDGAIDYITEDVSDLDSKSYASSVLMTLSDIAIAEISEKAASASSNLESSIHDEISDAFDDWSKGERESWDMGDIIEHASHFLNPEEVFPSYFDVASEISSMNKFMADGESPSDSRLREIDEPTSVDHILGSLRKDGK
ncbi:restriction endonuclease [Frankia sp. R82]|uniref:nSTAND3 domain-containing NTPase n=1 Tax=Frankia sp. R82 TaxID=2950553 RepID=UPI0020441B72|nr:restriction endonuclease [Frankia sp. R82]MCM3884791.1 restriction endonuclease [Frankia sp. R82]